MSLYSFAEKFDPIPITEECQVHASTMKDYKTKPYHAISTDVTKQGE